MFPLRRFPAKVKDPTQHAGRTGHPRSTACPPSKSAEPSNNACNHDRQRIIYQGKLLDMCGAMGFWKLL
jgi:hypothetical protein